jgi:hypothetical protein
MTFTTLPAMSNWLKAEIDPVDDPLTKTVLVVAVTLPRFVYPVLLELSQDVGDRITVQIKVIFERGISVLWFAATT